MLCLPLPDGETVFLNPVPFFYLDAYTVIRRSLPESIGEIATDKPLWELLQKLVNLHPRADIREAWGFPLPDNYVCLSGLLPRLDELNAVEPVPRQKQKQGELTIPLKSSGDGYADLLADLAALYGVDGAIALLKSTGANQLNKIVFRANEMARPHEKRQEEALSEALLNWEKQNQPHDALFRDTFARTNQTTANPPNKVKGV